MAILENLQRTGQGSLYSTMLSSPFIFPLLLMFVLRLLYKITRRGSKPKLPPSPPKLPIIGNIHQLGKLPHYSLRVLAKRYGPVMMMHLGPNPTLVVSSVEEARNVMKTHDITFANRPEMTAANILLYGCKNIGFAPYGEYWRQMKKISVVELLSKKMVETFKFVREEEVAILNDKLRKACLSGASVDLTAMLDAVSNNIAGRCTLGRTAEEDGGNNNRFGKLSRIMMEEFTKFCFRDVFPWFGWMDHLTGLISRLKASSKEADIFLDQVIEEHKLAGSDDNLPGKKDFVHILLKIQKDGGFDTQITQEDIKAILMDLFIAATDTSATTMEWVMAELSRNKNIMKKAQEEVRRVVGNKSEVETSDIDQMGYLKCVIKEALRLHPPLPLLVPREARASVQFGGYHISPKTRVLVNVFAIQRDPEVWERPDDFIPERFINNPVDFRGQDFEFLPFGAGRRGCPGITFGVTSVEFVVANLLHWFDWRLPDGETGEDMDMSEIDGLTVHKKVHLCVVPKLHTS